MTTSKKRETYKASKALARETARIKALKRAKASQDWKKYYRKSGTDWNTQDII